MIHSRKIVFQKRMIVIATVIVKVMMKKNKFLSTYCDDPDYEYCVPEKDDCDCNCDCEDYEKELTVMIQTRNIVFQKRMISIGNFITQKSKNCSSLAKRQS